MSKARLIITAVVVGGAKSAVARDYDVSRYRVHQLARPAPASPCSSTT
jgi:hypothetical protein